jgi:hypothetical protein
MQLFFKKFKSRIITFLSRGQDSLTKYEMANWRIGLNLEFYP